MLHYPQINPVAIKLGHLKIHWYGIMYLAGISAGWLLAIYRCKQTWRRWTREQVADMVFYTSLGLLIGGRVGYMLFYAFHDLITHPVDVLKTWQGGMSFHGGIIGGMLALWIFSRRHKKSYLNTLDFVTPLIPIGLACGRLGNFINGELWGRVSHVPWAMIFPGAGPLPRHPSQLYELLLEGVFLFIILWFYSRKPRPLGAVAGVFGVGYGVFRFLIEFVRQPDPQLGFIAFGWMTRGQELCIPMILAGIWLIMNGYCRHKKNLTPA